MAEEGEVLALLDRVLSERKLDRRIGFAPMLGHLKKEAKLVDDSVLGSVWLDLSNSEPCQSPWGWSDPRRCSVRSFGGQHDGG